MKPPTNVHQHRSPAGHPELPYLPGCTQIDPQPGSVEGWTAWGPTINGVHQTWLGLPTELDTTQVYATLQDYGLCLNGGDWVTFERPQEQVEEKPEMPEPLRLLGEGASSSQVDQSPAVLTNPNLARLAPVETVASEVHVDTPPPVETIGGAGWGTIAVVGAVSLGAYFYQQWASQMNVVADVEQAPADMSPAPTPVRPAVSTSIHAGTLIQQGVSGANQLANRLTNHSEPSHEPTFSVSRTSANQIEPSHEPVRTVSFNTANQLSPFPETARTKNPLVKNDRTREAAMQLVRQHLADMYEISETVDTTTVSDANQISPAPEPTPKQIGSQDELREKYFTLRNGGLHNKKHLALVLFNAKSGSNQAWADASQKLDDWKTEWEKSKNG